MDIDRRDRTPGSSPPALKIFRGRRTADGSFQLARDETQKNVVLGVGIMCFPILLPGFFPQDFVGDDGDLADQQDRTERRWIEKIDAGFRVAPDFVHFFGSPVRRQKDRQGFFFLVQAARRKLPFVAQIHHEARRWKAVFVDRRKIGKRDAFDDFQIFGVFAG